jgi:hypothetical protein
VRSPFSDRIPSAEGARSSWDGTELSVEVMDETGERRDEVEVVVLLRERPPKTDNRFGLWARAVDRERI